MTQATNKGLEGRVVADSKPEVVSQRVRVRRDRDNVYVTPEGPEMGFKAMSSYRKPLGCSASEMSDRLGSEDGILLANMGVSASLQVTDGTDLFEVVVRQNRDNDGFKDVVSKLVSGYVDVRHLTTPLDAALTEIAEEFVPITWGTKVIGGMYDGKPLEKPYDGVQVDDTVLGYDSRFIFNLHSRDLLITDRSGIHRNSVDPRIVHINDVPVPGKPRIYYSPGTASAQLLFGFGLRIDLSQIGDMQHAEKSHDVERILHGEDKKDQGVLKTFLGKEPLHLARIGDDGRLTGEFYLFRGGKMVDATQRLSEVFAPSSHFGIIEESNITVPDYLKRK